MFASKRWIPSCSLGHACRRCSYMVRQFWATYSLGLPSSPYPSFFRRIGDVRTVPLLLDLPHLSAGRDVPCVPCVPVTTDQLFFSTTQNAFISTIIHRGGVVYALQNQGRIWFTNSQKCGMKGKREPD